MKVIISHPTGNANVREAAKALAERNMLSAFYTAVASFHGSVLDKLGGINGFSEIRRRRFDPVLKPYTKIYPWFEIGRLATSKLGWDYLTHHTNRAFCIDAVYRYQDKHVAAKLFSARRTGVEAIYAYEDGARYSFGIAKQAGLRCIYDLPTGYWRAARRLLIKEHERWPEWMPTMTGFADPEEKLFSKDEELRLAERVLVASSFTASTLEDYPGSLPAIKIVPYGFPPVLSATTACSGINTKLKLLFVGKLTQQKGIADLFHVMDILKDYVSLTVIGKKGSEDCPALDKELTKHKWIPTLAHNEILQAMREHDILVFPSLFDGFGLVITEAMSQGTPVIASERSAGPDLIRHGENGWLFKAGSTTSLQIVIEQILQSPGCVARIALEAVESARSRTWEIYRKELIEAIK